MRQLGAARRAREAGLVEIAATLFEPTAVRAAEGGADWLLADDAAWQCVQFTCDGCLLAQVDEILAMLADEGMIVRAIRVMACGWHGMVVGLARNVAASASSSLATTMRACQLSGSCSMMHDRRGLALTGIRSPCLYPWRRSRLAGVTSMKYQRRPGGRTWHGMLA